MEEISRPSPPHATALPALALPQLVAVAGNYPARRGFDLGTNYEGMIQTFAGVGAYSTPYAHGQRMRVGDLPSLHALFGAAFGGDGQTTFALPDLHGRTAIGGRPGEKGEHTLSLTYMIATVGPSAGGEPPLGSVGLFGGDFAPAGWVVCDGSLLSAAEFPDLAAVVGSIFGGNGTHFAVPNLTGRAVYGAGEGPGVPPVGLGEVVEGAVPGLGLNYIICKDGLYSSPDEGGGAFPTEPFMGHVTAYPGRYEPEGWAFCDGALLATAAYPVLASILGTTYGGDGREAFGLPDLRGRVVVGK